MKARFVGFVLMITAMIAVVSGHVLIRPDVAGRAVGLDVPGAPQVGDCVLSMAPPDFDTPSTTVVFGSCQGPMAGEVVSVRPGAGPAVDQSAGSLMGTSGACWADASRYAGLPVTDGTAGRPAGVASGAAVPWAPVLQVRGQRIEADVLQRATGRDWTACVVRPEGLDMYLGSVRAALGRGTAPADYSDCATPIGRGWSAPVSCGQPHFTEVLGTAMVATGSVSAADLDSSCVEFASQVLRVADPTYGGRLRVVVVPGNVTSCEIRANGNLRLVGSLIGLAGRPIRFGT